VNIVHYLPALGLGALTMGLVVLLRSVISLHRRRQREHEELDLATLAESRGLNRQQHQLPQSLVNAAVTLGGKGRDGGLSRVLRGSDGLGTYHLCRRRLGRRAQQAFLFENNLLTLRGLRISPVNHSAGRWRALLRKLRHESPPNFALRMEWECESSSVDQRSVLMSQALYLLMAEAREVVEPLSIHLQVEDQRVAIHTRRPLSGDALRVFTDVAIELRRLVAEVPHKTGAVRLSPGESGRVPPVESEISRAVRMTEFPATRSGAAVPYGSLATVQETPPAKVPSAT
jgi:hypothetical protein